MRVHLVFADGSFLDTDMKTLMVSMKKFDKESLLKHLDSLLTNNVLKEYQTFNKKR